MNQLPLLFTSSKELEYVSKLLRVSRPEQLIQKLEELEKEDTTLVNAVRQYSRIVLLVLLLNKPNKDGPQNKLKLANSLGLLFSVKPLVKKLVDKYVHSDKINKKFAINAITLLLAFVKYPAVLKYQRNYLSVYFTIVASELLLEKYTQFKSFWLLFPLTFAKTWEYYNIDRANCPSMGVKILDSFCRQNGATIAEYLAQKLKIILFLVPGLTLLDYRKTKKIALTKPLAISTKVTLITLLVANLGQLLTVSGAIPVENEKIRLQLIGLISSLPTYVYRKNTAMWLYLTRVIMISINRKHSLKGSSSLNRFKVDKLLIVSALLVIMNFKDEDKLSGKKFINRFAECINAGDFLILK